MADRTTTNETEHAPIREIGYEPALDGIRGIGAVFVVLIHVSMLTIPEQGRFADFVPGAFVFMDMFFVLSGFLITALLLKEQQRTSRVSLRGFYRRRAVRLFPALWVLLGSYLVYGFLVGYDTLGGWPKVRSSVFFSLIYGINFRLTNFLAPEVSTGLTHLWSLGLEEQFYLVWPLFVIVVVPLTRRLSWTITVLGCAIVAIASRRYYLSVTDQLSWFQLYIRSDTRADSLLVGALTAYLWTHRKDLPIRVLELAGWVAVIFVAGYVALGELDQPFGPRGGYTVSAVAVACIILASLQTDWLVGRLLARPVIVAVGRASYSVYLWHFPILAAVAHLGTTWGPFWRLTVTLGVTALATVASYRWVEKPFLRLNKKRPSSGVPAAPEDTRTDPLGPDADAG